MKRIDLRIQDEIWERKKKLAKSWRKIIMAGLDALETPQKTPDEEFKSHMQYFINLYKGRSDA